MVKNPFWYKKYKHINWLKVSINCSVLVVYWRLLNQFSGGQLNNLLMLGLHHRYLPQNFMEIFQNTGRLLLAFSIYKVLISKKGKIIVTSVLHLHFFRFMFPENPESFSVFKNINSDFYNFKVFVTSRYLSQESFPSLL